MDVGTVLSVAQTLLSTIQCTELKQFCSLFGYNSDINTLQNVVTTITSVLRDAEAKQDLLSEQEKHYVKELKDAVYDADDVVDEFSILIRQNRLYSQVNASFSSKVRSYLSRFKPVAVDISRKVKKVEKKLDFIASKSSKFCCFKVDYQPIKCRRHETCSYVYANDIIGRDVDLENIVRMLLDRVENDVSQENINVSFVTIVGIGGLGKTALAQLVYNDERIESAFELRLWVCVSDQDMKEFNLFEVLGKIIESATGLKHGATTLDQVQKKLRAELEGKKYLLVLDDVWTENCEKWREFSRFLIGGVKGSRIVVTTRSRGTARVVRNGPMYELKGLTEEDSWSLFKRCAFESNQSNPSEDLVSIGLEIVKRCAYVPLAIRTMGSLLYGQPKKKWRLVKEMGLASIVESHESDIISILKLSYHNLTSPLKSCFAYCALFPKDYEIDKGTLISLWMAQGYIVPLDERQSVEDIGEEYFSILLRRCFFQDINRDNYGEVVSCKIHDLMHDIAQEVAGKEILELKSHNLAVDGQVRHLSMRGIEDRKAILSTRTNIRTYLQLERYPRDPGFCDQGHVRKLLTNLTCLRTLDLKRCHLISLPESIGNLIHLRYLDLSFNFMELLPKAITKLCELQTLKLVDCIMLRELPKDLSTLVSLSTLDLTTRVKNRHGLSHMPLAMSKLTRLHTLGKFVVGGKRCFDGLEDLKSLDNLKGSLCIFIGVPKNVSYMKEDHGGGAYLRNKELLNRVEIIFQDEDGFGSCIVEELLLDELQPHSNLKSLILRGYHGLGIPSWPNLVNLDVRDCLNLQGLSELGTLRRLKRVKLENLPCLEYLVSDSQESSLFPSLEDLDLINLPKMKSWCSRSHFSQLNKLYVSDCPEMTAIPVCPHLEALSISCRITALRLRKQKLYTSDLRLLKLLPSEYFKLLTEIVIDCDNKVETMSDVTELFQEEVFTSLRCLSLRYCRKLRNLCGWLEHFSSLEGLYIINCPNLFSPEEENDGVPWRHLSENLQRLEVDVSSSHRLMELPKGIQHLTSLKSLKVSNATMMESLPNWMPKLTSLAKLDLFLCSSSLKRRCRKPNGEDWSLIQHIPSISIVDEDEFNSKLPR